MWSLYRRPTSKFELRSSKVFGVVCLAFCVWATAFAQTTGTVRVTAATASIRADPKPTAAILTTVKAGTTLEVRGSDGDWLQVSMFVGSVRILGYVLKRSVAADTPATAAAPATTAAGAKAAPVAGGGPVAKFGMSATVNDGSKPLPLTPSVARVARIAERADSARGAAIAMPVGPGTPLPAGAASLVTYLWLIDGIAGARVVGPKSSFAVQYRDAPGISPDDFRPAVVELAATPSGPRVMTALRGRVDQASRSAPDWDVARDLKQDVVKSTVELIDRGTATITPAAALAPGEYAVVMRPTGNKKFAGTSVLSASADGRVFGIAWIFVVK